MTAAVAAGAGVNTGIAEKNIYYSIIELNVERAANCLHPFVEYMGVNHGCV